MSLQLKPLHPLFAAEASGIDIAKPIDAATVRAIDDAMDKYGVLVFRGQPLDQDQQVAFASSFGTLDSGLKKLYPGQPSRFRHEEMIDISNVKTDGSLHAATVTPWPPTMPIGCQPLSIRAGRNPFATRDAISKPIAKASSVACPDATASSATARQPGTRHTLTWPTPRVLSSYSSACAATPLTKPASGDDVFSPLANSVAAGLPPMRWATRSALVPDGWCAPLIMTAMVSRN